MWSDLPSIRQRISLGELDGLRSPSFLMPLPRVRHCGRIPPDAFASMAHAWQRVWYPPAPLRIRVFEDVFVAQDGLVLHPDGQVVEKTIEQHSAAAVAAARTSLARNARTAWPRLSGNIVLCRKSGAATYGHWLVELLPRAFLASHLPKPSRFLIQSIPGAMASLTRQTLSGLGIGAHALVAASHEPVWVERLVHVDGLTSHGGYMSPLAIECLQVIDDRIRPAGGEKLFVTRPPGAGRRLAEEARLTSRAKAAGFTVIEPGAMPFTQQVAAFKAARTIVGVMGSALTNLAFAQPGADVSVLAPATMPDTFFWFLCGHRKLRMTEIRCAVMQGEGHTPWDMPLVLDRQDEQSLFDPPPCRPDEDTGLFDPDYYAAENPDVVEDGCDLLDHYMNHGWREGRLPSPRFDWNAYLLSYPDVRASGLNPLFHFLRYGQAEGRTRFLPELSAGASPATPPGHADPGSRQAARTERQT